jgi:serine phosphatase RsbU (regulator of sigma subunit)/anti-sigma regulatory factor (Ser/Thr protein kinase)
VEPRGGVGPKARASAAEDALVRRLPELQGRLLAGALTALIALTAVAVLLAWRQYETGRREALREVQSRAILAGAILDTLFTGKLDALRSISASPAVTSGQASAMNAYFRRLARAKPPLLNGGLAWLDRSGVKRAGSNSRTNGLDVSDRSYFRRVVATGAPFIGEAIVTRVRKRRAVVIAVPTKSSSGRPSGVLAGALLLTPSRTSGRAVDLGYAGLRVIDRKGQQLTRQDLGQPVNRRLLAQLRRQKEGVVDDVRGLDGDGGHVVAYATAAVPGWKVVIDQPGSTVFAAARRALVLELALTAGAAALVLALILWAYARSSGSIRTERAQIRRWARFTRSLTEARDVAAIRTLLTTSLAAELDDALVVVTIPDIEGGRGTEVARGIHGPRVDDDEGNRLVRDAAGSSAIVDRLGRRHTVVSIAIADEHHREVGSVAALLSGDRHLHDHELTLLQAQAGQVGQAVTRARRQEHEHDTATLLQRSLLPHELPVIDGLDLAAHYEAAGMHEEVGGDWYDVVRRPDGIVHLTVGDVAGRGIRAAVLMGQLRHAFAAYALDHASPAAIVERLARHVQGERMATVACVAIDPFTHELAYASAGHVPPLLVEGPRGPIVRLDERGRPPLGWPADGLSPDATGELAPGTIVALYTDGLVERRDSSLDTQIDLLGASLQARWDSRLGSLVRGIVGRMGHPRSDDDTALLLARVGAVPAEIRIEIPARAELLRELRRRVRRWLTLRQVPENQREAATLAISEACNNSIEHGYRDGVGMITIGLQHAEGSLRIVVDDQGEWLVPRRQPTRGRGLVIMRGLMDDAHVTHGPRGTRITLTQVLDPRPA